MTTRIISRSLLVIFPLASFAPLIAVGCGDDSRATGTQVKFSEEAKAQIDDMRDMYKSTKATAKKKR